MASASHSLFFCVFFQFLILLLLSLIHNSHSCPNPIYLSCPDNTYNGIPPPPSSNNFVPNQCRELRDLSLQNRALRLCEVYLNLSAWSPISPSISLTNWVENGTFLGCPPPERDEYWDSQPQTKCGCGDTDNCPIVYAPFSDDAWLPARQPPHEGCMKFTKFCPNANKNKVPAKPAKDRRQIKKKLRIIIICSVLSGSAIFLIILIVYLKQRKNKSTSTNLSPGIASIPYTRSNLEEGSMNYGVTVFSYAQLQQVTNNFDPTRELGEGGFGVVYHGKLNDGREVAVKRMFEKNFKQIEQFKNEIKILTSVRHPNLVTLYGCSSRHSRELLLVYEYIPNGTLADHLHGNQSKSALLLWPARMKIAIETAAALSYLHLNDIIHRDIKTYNILLDRSFSAKVADFGLSRLFPEEVSHLTTAPQGTPGYLDPEYRHCYHLTDKSDVYSFGVVLIELISSLPAVDLGRLRSEVNLANYALNRIQCCAFDELVDANLGFERSFKVRRMSTLVAELAFRCLQSDRELRPTMKEVVEELKRIECVDYEELEVKEMGEKTSASA